MMRGFVGVTQIVIISLFGWKREKGWRSGDITRFLPSSPGGIPRPRFLFFSLSVLVNNLFTFTWESPTLWPPQV